MVLKEKCGTSPPEGVWTVGIPGRPDQHIGDAGVNTDAGVARDAGVKSPASPQTPASSVHALSDLTNGCTFVIKTDLQVTLARYFTRI